MPKAGSKHSLDAEIRNCGPYIPCSVATEVIQLFADGGEMDFALISPGPLRMGALQHSPWRSVTWPHSQVFLCLSADQSSVIAQGGWAPDKHHVALLAVFKV